MKYIGKSKNNQKLFIGVYALQELKDRIVLNEAKSHGSIQFVFSILIYFHMPSNQK